MTIRGKRGRKYPLPRPLHRILIMSILKASLEETQGINSQGTLVNSKHSFPTQETTSFRMELQLHQPSGRIFSFPPPPTLKYFDHWSHLKAVSPISEGPVWGVHCEGRAHVFSLSRNPSRHLVKGSQEVECERMCHLGWRGYWQSLQQEATHSPLFSAEMGSRFHFQGRLLLWSLICSTTFWPNTHVQTGGRGSWYREAFWELWGHPTWLTVSETASKDPRSWYSECHSFSPSV